MTALNQFKAMFFITICIQSIWSYPRNPIKSKRSNGLFAFQEVTKENGSAA